MQIGIAVSLGFRIMIRSNSKRTISYLSDIGQRAIPDYSFSLVTSQNKNVDWIIDIYEKKGSNHLSFDTSKKRVTVNFSPDRFWQSDLEFLLLYLFSDLYLHKKIICANAVGLVSPDGAGIMITGETGSGKSITGLQLLMQGYRFIGNDRLLLKCNREGIKMVGGTSPIRLRKATIDRYFPQMAFDQTRGEIRWGEFNLISPDQYGFRQARSTLVKMFARVKVSPITDHDCTCYPLKELDKNFAYVKIYQPLSFYSVGGQLIHLSTMSVYPSISNRFSDVAHFRMTKKIAERVPCYELHGNLEWVAKRIDSLIRGEKNEPI